MSLNNFYLFIIENKIKINLGLLMSSLFKRIPSKLEMYLEFLVLKAGVHFLILIISSATISASTLGLILEN